ncbi:hypothetical protein [Streptomyces collinus]|uniref:hypothetical protein n=1 Tax=Streptomyces collinus TaxID=42684 RepID=UPI0036F109F5
MTEITTLDQYTWLYRVVQAGVGSERLLSAPERRQVLQALDNLLGVLSAVTAEELPD